MVCLFLGGATERVVEEGMIGESEGLSLYFCFLIFLFFFCGFRFQDATCQNRKSQYFCYFSR